MLRWNHTPEGMRRHPEGQYVEWTDHRWSHRQLVTSFDIESSNRLFLRAMSGATPEQMLQLHEELLKQAVELLGQRGRELQELRERQKGNETKRSGDAGTE